jgi:mitochondrial genome maintenance exonuclease 1
VIHDHLSGKPVVPTTELEGCWSSLSKVLPDLGKILNLESPVCHPTLQYRGIIDCVAEFRLDIYHFKFTDVLNIKPIRGEPMVIEWKKSDRKKPIIQYTYDAPLQMTAYIGAINFDKTYSEKVCIQK